MRCVALCEVKREEVQAFIVTGRLCGGAEIISLYFSSLVNPWNFDERAESPKK